MLSAESSASVDKKNSSIPTKVDVDKETDKLFSSPKASLSGNAKSLKELFLTFIQREAHVKLVEGLDSPCRNAKYNVSCSALVIVAQFLPYVQRNRENRLVVDEFKNRRDLRQESRSADKQCNPLLVIPAAPGSGKSSFLANFPGSPEFEAYCGGTPAIVAPLTFNSMMCTFFEKNSIKCPTLGLRILFGAAMVMRDTESVTSQHSEHPWSTFLAEFGKYNELSSTEAVGLLREVYGQDRPVLVLVDELSKSMDEKETIEEVFNLLEIPQTVDVLVSALSPMYIEKLVALQRPIRYVIMESLVGRNLGGAEAKQWSIALLSKCGKTAADMDKYALPFLQHIPFLLSGHPRSIQYLIWSFDINEKDDVWFKIVCCIRCAYRQVTLPEVIGNVMDDLTSSSHPVYPQLKQQIKTSLENAVELLDLALQFNIDEANPNFQSYLECGCVYILPKSSYSKKIRTTISLVSFLELVTIVVVCNNAVSFDEVMKLYPRVDAAVKLFDRAAMNAGELFERVVALTVMCYSYLVPNEVKKLFGCKDIESCSIPMTAAPRLTIRLASTLAAMMISTDGVVVNELVSAPRHFPSFDGRVTIQDAGAAQYYYIEARVAPELRTSQTESEVRVSKVVTMLLVHYLCTLQLSPSDQLASFRSVFMIFYEWGALQCMSDVSRSQVRAEISATLGNVESADFHSGQPIPSSVTDTLTNAPADSGTIVASLGGMFRSVMRRLSRTGAESSKPTLTLNEIRNGLLNKCNQADSCSGVLEAIKTEASQQSLLRQHMVQCFDAYLAADDDHVQLEPSESVRAYVVNRAVLEEWLVPPVSPIPYLLEAMELTDTS